METTGERLTKLRRAAKMTQNDIANELGLDRTAYTNYETGKRLPTSRNLIRLSRIFGVSCDYLMCESDDPSPDAKSVSRKLADKLAAQSPVRNVKPVPVIGTVKAGYGGVAYEELQGYEYLDVNDPDEYFILTVRGDSMSPLIENGDQVVVYKQDSAETGDVVVAVYDGDEATVKKFIQRNGYVILQPMNPTVEPLVIRPTQDEPLYIVGRVIKVIHTL